ncbi:hypothetical protein [Roseivirga sp. E12]|uniref:hypothetical protein n=1 Tax=Roseivirga sp. E12 TaxID=2819237 RepID=UPI001ABC45D4|nr:hypothetical protein [Roseivirga sp. E12]MBO3697754.1 hypothetical protein [Roseivirga sp. E12]
MIFFIVFAYSCTTSTQKTSQSDCGCEELWNAEPAQEFVRDLEKAGTSNQSVWLDFQMGDGAIVLDAGKNEEGKHCLGLWKKGKALSYRCLVDKPKMLTQLYSYYLNYQEPITSPVPEAFLTTKNSPEFNQWMTDMKIETAVYIPTDFPQFPFKIPSMTKVQLAIHESFHIEVQLKKWYTDKGNWPVWDKQPNRQEVHKCYDTSETTQGLINKEITALANLIEALLDNNKTQVCELGSNFLSLRDQRYQALDTVTVKQHNDLPGNCTLTETYMEAEEGIADYASWTKLFEAGLVGREALLRRYTAQQKDHFYLTGSMLLHAIVLMNGGNDKEVIQTIINSETPEAGALTNLFRQHLEAFCK